MKGNGIFFIKILKIIHTFFPVLLLIGIWSMGKNGKPVKIKLVSYHILKLTKYNE